MRGESGSEVRTRNFAELTQEKDYFGAKKTIFELNVLFSGSGPGAPDWYVPLPSSFSGPSKYAHSNRSKIVPRSIKKIIVFLKTKKVAGIFRKNEIEKNTKFFENFENFRKFRKS